MELSYSMKYILLRAQSEAKGMHVSEPGIEFFFLGLLKMAEIQAKDAFNLPDTEMKTVDADIAAVREMFRREEVDTDRVRPQLRHELKHGARSDAGRLQEYLLDADRAAK